MWKTFIDFKKIANYFLFVISLIVLNGLLLILAAKYKIIWSIFALLFFTLAGDIFLLVQRKSFIEANGIEKMYQLFNAFIQLMLVPALFYILGKYF